MLSSSSASLLLLLSPETAAQPSAFATTTSAASGTSHTGGMHSTSGISHHITATSASPSFTSVTLPKLRIPSEGDAMTTQHQWPGFQGHQQRPRQQEAFVRADPRGCADTRPRAEGIGYYSAPPAPVKTSTASATNGSDASSVAPRGPQTRSPSSPSSFFTQPENSKFGLAHLLEAAEQVRPSMPESSSPKYYERRDVTSASSPLKRQFLQPLPSLMHSMGGYPLEPTPGPKRARILSDVGLDMQASYRLLGNLPHQAMIYPSVPEHHSQQQHQPQEYYSTSPQVAAWNPPRSQVQSPNSAGSASPPSTMRGLPSVPGISAEGRFEAPSVWENVLSTGKFPSDICLSEHGNSTTAPSTPPFTPHGNRSSTEIVDIQSESDASYEVKQGRWSSDEEEYAQTLIEAVKSGEVVLPPNVSVRKFIADSLQCKAMRVSKKFRSLGAASQSPRDSLDEQEEAFTPRDESFNPLSLRSIMNTDATASSSASDVFDVAEAMANARLIRQSPTSGSPGATKRSSQRVLKRSDYSQHGMVRSGRWSVEEENYAKAMIEAFKSGYLPLHGNVSLRKFLSEVLVCHPMRISKKFVGYVRKYHWYRIAAGKSDPEAKRQALHHLCHLERVFWTSLQQNNEWSAGLRRDD